MKQKNHSKNKKLATKQADFIRALEGIGDILVFETGRRNKNKSVIQGLNKIQNIMKTFLTIQKNDPERFERLLLAQEFFDLYRGHEEEAKWSLTLDPERYLVSFSAALNQILRIHEKALDVKNEEISKFATYHLSWILAEISQTPKNDVLVEQLLRNLFIVTKIAIENQDSSMYAASIHWYIDIVFNKLRQQDGSFNLSYLGLFDRYFFSSAKYIISENQMPIFQSLIRSLVDSITIPLYGIGNIWDYRRLLIISNKEKYQELDKKYDFNHYIRDLEDSVEDIDTRDRLDKWLERFNELKKIIGSNLVEGQEQSATDLEKNITEGVISSYKYYNLLEIVFAIGAYCLFKQEPDYIKYLWEYKQPPDSDATWVGHDIVPNTLDRIVTSYFKRGLFQRRFEFWEDHHGSEVYFKSYFVLLLARVLRTSSPGEIEGYNLPKLHIYQLSGLEQSIEGLIQVAKRLKNQEETLRILGFDLSQLDKTFEQRLIPFLVALKTKAQEHIKSIQRDHSPSPRKTAEFKEKIVEGFYESVILRNIFKHFNLYEDRTSQSSEIAIVIPWSSVYDKAAFFEEWHVHYVDWGISYGRGIGAEEDSVITDLIRRDCVETKETEFEEVLEKYENLDDVIILAARDTLYEVFKTYPGFRGKWYSDCPQLEVNGFKGSYLYQGQYIPVFEIQHREPSIQIMILNKSKLGKLIQFSPENVGEQKELITDIFCIQIRAFSENNKLLMNYLKKPPKWLEEIGEPNARRAHLEEKVLVEISEYFVFDKSENFEGYLFNPKKKENEF